MALAGLFAVIAIGLPLTAWAGGRGSHGLAWVIAAIAYLACGVLTAVILSAAIASTWPG